MVPSAKGDCWFLLTSEAGPDTHVREEKPCGEQAQPQKLWGAQARLLLSPHGNPLGEEGRANPQGTERPQQDAQSWEALRSRAQARSSDTEGSRDACSLVAVLGQAIDTSGVDELLVPDLLLEETLQLLYIDLCHHRACHHKHLQHAVNPLQGQALQVGQHSLDVRPEQLRRVNTQQ